MGNWRNIKGFLGLANRAGKLVVGAPICEELMLQKKVTLLLLAEDLSPNSASRLGRIAERNSIPLRVAADKQKIGSALGRTSTGIVGVLDKGFARAILALFSEEEK